MSFTPAIAALQYSQGQSSPSIQVTFDRQESEDTVTSVNIANTPEWLTVFNIFTTDSTIRFFLRVDEDYASSMQPGDYTAIIEMRYKFSFSFSDIIETYAVSLNVGNFQPLSVSPSVIPFQYFIGDSAPLPQTITIISQSNWSLTTNASWLDVSPNQSSNSGTVSATVNPVGLSAGSYSDTITVTDSSGVREVAVSLLVSQQSTDSVFINVTPNSLNFVSQVGEANATTKTITIESSNTWAATNNDAWLVLSANTGSSGVSTLEVSVDSAALTNTDIPYIAEIVFTSQGITKSAFVQLILVPFQLSGIASENTYFADDRNKLQVSNIFANMFLYLEGFASSQTQNLELKKAVPFQNGLAKVLLGLEANTLISAPSPLTSFSSRVFNQIKPISLNFSAYNKEVFSNNTTLIQAYSNVRFFTGKTPITPDKFCYTPNEITVTKDAVIVLSARSTSDIGNITITGDATSVISSSFVSGDYMYSAIINLQPLNLSEGNTITINWAGFDYKVNIKPKSLEQTLIAFENEWRRFEFFECTGALTVVDDAQQTLTEIQVEAEKHTETVDIDSGGTFTVNTGWIYSQNEIDWLSKILKSKRIYIYINGTPVKSILTSKNLEIYKTRENLRSYNLKFKKAVIV